jgi:hypothetical protein
MILDQGAMPLVSLNGQDAVRVARFQSIAEPLRALDIEWCQSCESKIARAGVVETRS